MYLQVPDCEKESVVGGVPMHLLPLSSVVEFVCLEMLLFGGLTAEHVMGDINCIHCTSSEGNECYSVCPLLYPGLNF